MILYKNFAPRQLLIGLKLSFVRLRSKLYFRLSSSEVEEIFVFNFFISFVFYYEEARRELFESGFEGASKRGGVPPFKMEKKKKDVLNQKFQS